jgi:hypothetical protein
MFWEEFFLLRYLDNLRFCHEAQSIQVQYIPETQVSISTV